MKRVGLFIVILFFIGSCKEDDNFYWGVTDITQNGMKWSTEVYAQDHLEYGFDLQLDHFENGFKNEGLRIYKIPFALGDYLITATTTRDSLFETGAYSVNFYGDGDAFGDVYRVLVHDNFEDFVSITEIDDDVVSGYFQVSLAKETIPGFDPNRPDSIYFYGFFRTRLTEF